MTDGPALRLVLFIALPSLCHGFLLPASWHPYYPPPVASSIQRWDCSTLREQIKAGRIARAGIYQDETSVEVLDTNGLQRRVQLFPAAAPLIVHDLHEQRVEFFVIPAREPSPFVPLAKALISVLFIVWVIEALGFMEYLVLGCYLVGSGIVQCLEDLDAWSQAAAADVQKAAVGGMAQHDASCDALVGKLTGRSADAQNPQPPSPLLYRLLTHETKQPWTSASRSSQLEKKPRGEPTAAVVVEEPDDETDELDI